MIDDIHRYLIKELAADSDLGTSAESFESIIKAYHSKNSNSSTYQQTVDSHYISFIWKIFSRNKTVTIGKLNPKVPELVSKTQDFIDGKNGKRLGQKEDLELKKGLKFNRELFGEPVETFPPKDEEKLKKLAWEELKRNVGDDLRILMDKNLCKEILLGSTDFGSIADDPYETLKIITRAREEGVSSVAIAWSPFLPKPQTQSGVFAYVKSLQDDKGLVYKVAANTHGNHATKIFSKAYLKDSSVFTGIKERSSAAISNSKTGSVPSKIQSDNGEKSGGEVDSGVSSSDPLSYLPSRACFTESTDVNPSSNQEEDGDEGEDRRDQAAKDSQVTSKESDEALLEVNLDSIEDVKAHNPAFLGDQGLNRDDAKSVWDLNKNLARLRCLKLVQLSKDGVCVRDNFARRAGFESLFPVHKKALMRFTADLVGDGYLKPGNINISGRKPIRTLLLTDFGEKVLDEAENDEDGSGAEARNLIASLTRALQFTVPALSMEATLERQFVEHVASKGSTGSTTFAVSASLHGSKAVERFLDLSQYDQNSMKILPHLSDTGLGSILEQDSRLKFHRIHTYQTLESLNLQSAVRGDGGSLLDFESIKDFPKHRRADFYLDEEEFKTTLEDTRYGKWIQGSNNGPGKAIKPAKYKNVDEQGLPIIGRPRKPRDPTTGEIIGKSGPKKRKLKHPEEADDDSEDTGEEEENKKNKTQKKGKGKKKQVSPAQLKSGTAPSNLKRKAIKSSSNPISDADVEKELTSTDEELEELLQKFPDRSFDLIIPSTPSVGKFNPHNSSSKPTKGKSSSASTPAGRAAKRVRAETPEADSTPSTFSPVPIATPSNAKEKEKTGKKEYKKSVNEAAASTSTSTSTSTTAASSSNVDSSLMPPPASKGAKTPYIKVNKLNITRMNRSRICEQFFEEAGGVVSESGAVHAFREFSSNHPELDLGDTPGSRGGFLSDRRTRHSLLGGLVSEGKLRRTELFVENGELGEGEGASSPVVIWHVPGADPALIKEVAMSAQGNSRGSSRGLALTEKQKDAMKDRIENHQDLEDLLNDKSISDDIRELYPIACQARGFILAAVARRKALHLEIMKLIDSKASPVLSSEKGIVDLSYFWSECPLQILIQFVNPLKPSDPALISALDGRQQRHWPVDLQPEAVLAALRPDRGMRLIRELVRDLSYFKFARPASASDFREDEEVTLTPDVWRFSFDEVSVFPLRAKRDAVFAGKFPIRSKDEAETVWKQLEKGRGTQPGKEQISSISKDALKILRSSSAWGVNKLFGVQIFYISRFLEESDPETILSNSDLVKRIAHGCCTSTRMVKRCLLSRGTGKAAVEDLEAPAPPPSAASASAAHPREEEDLLEKGPEEFEQLSEAEQKKALRGAKKRAKETRKRRIQTWDDGLESAFIARSCTPEQQDIIVKSLKRLRAQYLMGRTKLSDEDLTSIFTSAMDAVTSVKKGPGDITRKFLEVEKSRKQMNETGKRQKIEWTPTLDEILHDSVVILRARDEQRGHGSAPNWSALRQVLSPHFPISNLEAFRRRFHFLANQVGEEAYLANLQEQWTRIWKRYRGTDVLPDPNPNHPTEFSLGTHLEFFRKHVRKDLAEAAMKKSAAEPLPGSDEIGVKWEFPSTTPETTWEGFFKITANLSVASRFHVVSDLPFTMGISAPASLSPSSSSPRDRNAENIIKMIVQTDEADFSEEAASFMIQQVGEDLVASLTEKLLEYEIIESVGGRVAENRRLPGRNYRLSDRNPALEDTFRREILTETSTAIEDLESKYDEEKSLLIGPDVQDAEVSALLEMLRSESVSSYVDHRDLEPIVGRYHLNTRVMSDEANELPLFFHVASSSLSGMVPSISTPPPPPAILSLVDSARGDFDRLEEILEERWKDIENLEKRKSKSERNLELLKDLKADLENAGENGLDLMTFKPDARHSTQDLVTAVESITSDSAQLAFYEGVDLGGNPRLISSRFLKSWVLRLPDSSGFVSPRAWYDIEGSVVESSWQKAVESVILIIVARPGILLSHLVARLSRRYSPQEVREAVEASESMGVVQIEKDEEGKVNLQPSNSWMIKSGE